MDRGRDRGRETLEEGEVYGSHFGGRARKEQNHTRYQCRRQLSSISNRYRGPYGKPVPFCLGVNVISSRWTWFTFPVTLPCTSPPPPVSPVCLIGQSSLGPLMCLSGSPLSAISPPALGKALDKDRWPLTYSPLTPDWLSVCVDQISAPRHTKGYSFWNSTRTYTHTRTHTHTHTTHTQLIAFTELDRSELLHD